MTVDLIVVGKTDSEAVGSLVEKYLKRLNHYVKFSVVVIPDRKGSGTSAQAQKIREGEMILNQLRDTDHVVLLDEKGELFRSADFASWLEKHMTAGGRKRLVFVTGGAHGFSSEVYERADEKVSLSPMTFSHQLVRIIFAEQLYRAFTIIRNEPYHHE